jgi:1A family penicillin-binding protein
MQMVKNRTGPLSFLIITKILNAIGNPLFQGLLLTLFASLYIISLIAKSLIHLIKLLHKKKLDYSKHLRFGKSNVLKIIYSELTKLTDFKKKLTHYLFQILKLRNLHFSLRLNKRNAIAITFLSTAVILTLTVYTLVNQLPNPDKLVTRDQIISTKIYDRNGNLLFKIFKNENRTVVKLQEIPSHLIKATIAVEDKDFYKHAGYSYTGILRAIRQMIFGGKLQGGSTITQQLVKNALLTKERSFNRKIKEIVLAVIAETKFTKNEILTMYFNEVAYGGAAYGVEEASQMYFDKSVKNLSLAEAALLAGLPAAPTYYSPLGTQPELAKFRQHEVLRRMVEDGHISAETSEKAKAEKVKLSPKKTDIKAPHFVMYVKELLVDKFGEQLVEQGGLEVITSLDLNIQNLAQQAVTQEVNNLSVLNIKNGAALVTAPATGEILAMVGSKDFFDFENDGQVNISIRPRQPGSAIKPVNYSVALENGFTPATILSDTPITYHIPGQPPYSPKNYDNAFHGNITLRQALANSYNVPAVKTLSTFGVEKMIEKGQLMGITTWDDKSKFGLSLTLGGGEITMIDLATVYSVLANRGYRVDLAPILQVSDYRGKLLYQYQCQNNNIPERKTAQAAQQDKCNAEKVVNPEVAFLLSDILSDNNARSQAFGRHSLLNIPNQQVAVKTGTTQNLRDNWTIGYTSDFLVATWVGNNDNSSMSHVASGITGATPIWNKVMTAIISSKPQHNFEPPETIITKEICPFTGTLSCQGCPIQIEYFIKGTEPASTCILIENQDIPTSENLQLLPRQFLQINSSSTELNEVKKSTGKRPFGRTKKILPPDRKLTLQPKNN